MCGGGHLEFEIVAVQVKITRCTEKSTTERLDQQ